MTILLPSIVTLVPTYIGWSKLGLTDTFLPLILPAFFGGGAFSIFLLRQFLLTIPRDLDESAVMDGAGYFTIYSKIILPLVRPALVAVIAHASDYGRYDDHDYSSCCRIPSRTAILHRGDCNDGD
jgi:multiple sugar transport system permease protein